MTAKRENEADAGLLHGHRGPDSCLIPRILKPPPEPLGHRRAACGLREIRVLRGRLTSHQTVQLVRLQNPQIDQKPVRRLERQLVVHLGDIEIEE